MLTYQMAPRRNNNNDADNDNNMLPGMQQLLEAQAHLIQLLTQNMANNNHNPPPPPPPPPQVDMLTRFLRLNPPKFLSSSEPILADDWLRSVNKYLVTIGCSKAKSVRIAAHLLEGPMSSWPENYQVTHPIGQVTWLMFQEAFRTAHVSAGAMSLK